ncbi:MAG TPA: glutamate-1-semialdehyde-2,1-aminomutase [Lachnospiraceae bacterium]|nr:glutamate-1-semialdehyde-2,1-aminomutase [Lachnospiraceae bacterium]
MEAKRSAALFERAVKCIPGGVNSPVRAYGSVGMTPRFIQGANGPYVFDEDGNKYIDYIGSWGPMILGHNNPMILEAVVKTCQSGLSFGAATRLEVEMAEFICQNIRHMDMVRMVNSGTEAVMSAIRAARGYTGRNIIVKFAGCYHGHCDAMLVKAGSGVMTAGIPDSAGVPKGCTQDTMTAVYNDLDSVREIFSRYPDQVAAVIVEPVAANMGVVLPEDGFLQGLQELCRANGAVFILDEVITGFRLAFGGAAEYYGLEPDLRTYGKIIGAGMPVGAYGGKKEIMEMVAPVGPVYQAGTLSGNPVAMAAGLAQLRFLYENPRVYSQMADTAALLFDGMEKLLAKYEIPCTMNRIASLGCLYFTREHVTNYEIAGHSDTEAFAGYFRYMIDHGIHLGPSQFEAMFISASHTEETTEETLAAFEGWLKEGK